MHQNDNFAFLLNNVSFEELHASTYDTIVIESGVLGLAADGSLVVSQNDFITAEQIATLRAEGRTVLAYLNVSVTDDNRTYWDDAWIDTSYLPNFDPDAPNVENTDISRGGDFGVLTGHEDTPDWLIKADSVAENFGYIVDWTDPEWIERLQAEAAALIDLGYDGLFLDDVGRYTTHRFVDPLPYGLGSVTNSELAEQALSMMQTILEIAREVPDAFLVTNGGVDIAAHAALGGNSDSAAIFAQYADTIDGLLMEAQHLDNPIGDDPAWDRAISAYGEGFDFFALEHSLSEEMFDAFWEWALLRGITGAITDGDAYDTVPILDSLAQGPVDNTGNDAIIIEGTGQVIQAGSGQDTVTGSAAADEIFGGAGADSLLGMDGDDIIFGDWNPEIADLEIGQHSGDTIYGGAGNDTIYGSAGDDLIFAGDGDDVVYGGGGNDTIIGGAGSDMIYGEAGDDLISGGASGDLLSGGNGNDIICGGDLPDTFIFDF